MTEDLVEGWTGNIDVTLLADGVAINGTGLTVTLILRDRAGALVNVTGLVNWLSASAGTVRYSPAAEDLKAARAPYAVRYKVTDTGKDVFFPNGDADTWKVRT